MNNGAYLREKVEIDVDKELKRSAEAFDVELLFRLILNRHVIEPYSDAQYVQDLVETNISIEHLAGMLLGSFEFRSKFLGKDEVKSSEFVNNIDNFRFRVPQNISEYSFEGEKVLLIGSCLMGAWKPTLVEAFPTSSFDVIMFNNASVLPNIDSGEASKISFQIAQIPLRSILPESLYFNLQVKDLEGHENAFNVACERLDANLDSILKYSIDHNIPSFVLNFLTPQQNPLGRFQKRYDKSNMVYFIEELNRYLYSRLESRQNVHFVDFDQIVSCYGKKYFQDDSIAHYNHGSALGGIIYLPEDGVRLEHPGDVDELYAPRLAKSIIATFVECIGQMRSITQKDCIKLVIFDLDDTLWRGVAADEDEIDYKRAEGWPLGILEAASYLWKRGVLIAIVSKNDEENALRVWNSLYERSFPINNFVARLINWDPKPSNIERILDQVNLLPQNVLFVDDNPVERAAVKGAFPQIHLIEGPLAVWRRILLWSAELQPAQITDEGASRTDMIRAQIRRDEARSAMNRDDFLASLGVSVRPFIIRDTAHPKFDRSIELLNKTNQFNTTGRRWTHGELQDLFSKGGFIIAADVADKYTSYGLVSLFVILGTTLEQFVLSCRVFGMGIEYALLGVAVEYMSCNEKTTICARLVETERNKLAMQVYPSSGFAKDDDKLLWHLDDLRAIKHPAHVTLEPISV